MIPVASLPTVNALLNTLSAALLICGYLFIRQRRIAAHKASMLGAFAASSLFLISYLIYHSNIGSRAFQGQGWIRPVYYAILLSHVVLAAAILPLAIVTLKRAWTGQFERHAWIARRTLPIWLYVSVTGVAVYWMLYRM
jgi:uncharacterized membrane protein YozB (DUF420 family)